MKTRNTLFGAAIAVTMFCSLPASSAVVAQDVVTVGTVNSVGATADVPVFIRDTSGTPLGIDQPSGSRIQSYSLKVNYSPASAVSSVTFTRAGITTSLTPTFENSPSGPGTVTLLDTFQESTNLIPFTLDGALPGNQVAHLSFVLSPSAVPGTPIVLTLDPTLTQLTDEGGSAATKEMVSNGRLQLVPGAINVTTFVPALGTVALMMLAAALVLVAVIRMRM
jgi:hypothetical protein